MHQNYNQVKDRYILNRGIIYNIQRFSVYDGPGIRTAVFFKGCNLTCCWCHNPESIYAGPVLKYNADNCIGCGACFAVCPTGSHKSDDSNHHYVDRDMCTGCLLCTDTCFAEALIAVGQTMTADELTAAVLSDLPYYERGGGGATFTGGECMLQHVFLAEVMRQLKEQNVHTAVDTAGNVPWERFELILPFTDLFLYDIKAADPAVHKKWTGVSNELILKNLRRLAETGKRIWIRVPYIPGRNDSEMQAVADIIAPLAPERVDILPYHMLGEGKYKALGLQNLSDIAVPDDEEIQNVLDLFKAKNISAIRS